jgi:GTP-binding protein
VRNQTSQLEFLGSFTDDLPVTGLPEVAFAGRSNVGKSSLLNRVLNRKRAARVSSTPGRTQRINLFKVGEDVVFADLPGYGFAKVPAKVRNAWKVVIEDYLGEREALRLVVVLVDARRDPTDLDGQLIEGLTEANIPILVVATKVDKLKKQALARQLTAIRRVFALPASQPWPFSAITGEGLSGIWDHIEKACKRGGRGA